MTFRLPFQIFRAVPIPRPPSPDRLVSPRIANTLQRNIASAAVKTTKNLSSPTNCSTKQNKSLLPRFVPSYSFQRRFKSNLENRKKVRKQHKCHERKCEQKLIFRQTTREECEKCLGPILVPDKCPKLSRLKPHYDQSKLKYDHGKCPVKCKAPRMDEVKGVQVVKKKLPKLPKGDCVKCSNSPTVAPELGRPLKLYEPTKLEQAREKCGPCDVCAPRMDDVVGLKVSHKTLPKLPVGDCEPCKNVPTILPRLAPLKPLYDASKLEQIRICKEPDCANPQRIDDIIGLKVEPKELPKLPIGDCGKCSNKPTYAPKLVRLKSKYDASKLKWLHVECKKCDVCAPRMDDVVGYKVEKKTLPKLIAKCLRCIPNPPTIFPKLVRPGKMYDDTQLKWKHTECKKCDICVPRMDDVVGYKIKRKKLPVLKPSEECTYCKNIPTVAPKLVRPKKQYDDTEMKWKHEKCPLVCKPPRSDIVCGYKVVPKTLKKIPIGDCKICINKPLHAPELKRLKKKYDASKLKWNHSDCNKCDICAPRMDDVMGLKIKKKHLPKLPVGDCEPCIVKPKYAPELKRLEKRYDPTKLKWKHVDCNPCKCPPRMDDVMGYKVTPKRLPKLESLECIQCKNPPSYAPELKRLKKRYDPSKLEKVRKPKPCLCDLDPPRMDDVKCWKPKKKILPAFNSKCQARHFSTFAVRRKYTPKMLQTLRKKAYNYSRRFKSKKISECCPPEPSKCDAPKQDPKCLKPCPKFKMKYCKQPDSTICREYKEKTCKKLCAPYDAYTDRMGDMYEDEMSECINWNDVLLQPKKQVSGTFYKLKPPPPKWDHIDPALERNCIACAKPCPIPRNKKPEWCNPCTEFKMKNCKPRGRKHCNDFTKKPLCKKLEAPYPSFTDYCPQFPEKELDECEIAENLKHEYMVNYYGQSMKYKKEYGNFGDCNDYCKPKCTECKATGIGMKTFPKCRQKPKDKGKCRPVKFPFRWMKCRSKVGENDDCRIFDENRDRASFPMKISSNCLLKYNLEQGSNINMNHKIFIKDKSTKSSIIYSEMASRIIDHYLEKRFIHPSNACKPTVIQACTPKECISNLLKECKPRNSSKPPVCSFLKDIIQKISFPLIKAKLTPKKKRSNSSNKLKSRWQFSGKAKVVSMKRNVTASSKKTRSRRKQDNKFGSSPFKPELRKLLIRKNASKNYLKYDGIDELLDKLKHKKISKRIENLLSDVIVNKNIYERPCSNLKKSRQKRNKNLGHKLAPHKVKDGRRSAEQKFKSSRNNLALVRKFCRTCILEKSKSKQTKNENIICAKEASTSKPTSPKLFYRKHGLNNNISGNKIRRGIKRKTPVGRLEKKNISDEQNAIEFFGRWKYNNDTNSFDLKKYDYPSVVKKYEHTNTFPSRPCSRAKTCKFRPYLGRSKTYGPFKSEKRMMSTYSKTGIKDNKTEKRTKEDRNNLRPYLRLNNDYLGKIYQAKLSRNSIRKKRGSKKLEEEPYTICHYCRIIPKQEYLKLEKTATKKLEHRFNRK